MAFIYEKKLVNTEFPFNLSIMNGERQFLYHWHEETELLYSISGHFDIEVENERYRVSAGESIIIASGARHCLFPGDASSIRIAILCNAESIFSRMAFEEDKSRFSKIARHSTKWPKETEKKVGHSIALMRDEFFAREPGWMEVIYSQLLNILTMAIREMPDARSVADSPLKVSALRRTLEYLAKNYMENISLKTCAEELGYNEAYLSSMFKRRTGTSLHNYILDLRINQAEWLLKNEDITIAEVAEKSGFASVKTFHRQFQQKYNMSPGAYRKQVQADD